MKLLYYTGLYRGYLGIMGFYKDNGKENGNYHILQGFVGGYIGFLLGLYSESKPKPCHL